MCWFILLICIQISYTQAGNSSGITQHYHKISPVAGCNVHQSINVMALLDDCHKKCSAALGYNEKMQITLMKDVSDMQGPTVTHCKKLKITQTFTETWTFSLVKSPAIAKHISVTEDECKSAIKEHCPEGNCDVDAPLELKEQYYYASDNTVEETYIQLKSHPSTLIELNGELRIAPSLTRATYIAGSEYARDDKTVFFWRKPDPMTVCPYSRGLTMGCDLVNYEDTVHAVCGGGRLAFRYDNRIGMSGACKDVYRSENGLLFAAQSDVIATDYKSQKIGLQTPNKLAADAETVRVLSQHAIFHVDSDLCSLQCEVAGLEMRTARRSMTLVRSGPDYVLITPKGHGYPCDLITQCRVNKPYKFCGSPTSFSIKCNGRDYYWDPTKNYVLQDGLCSDVTTGDTLTINMGNKLIRLDDNLAMPVNESDTFTHKSRSYMLYHEPLFKAEELDDLRREWISKKTSNKKLAQATGHIHDVDQKHIFSEGLISSVSNAVYGFFKVLSHVDFIIITGLVLIAVSLIIKTGVFQYLFKSKSRKNKSNNKMMIEETELIAGKRNDSSIVWM